MSKTTTSKGGDRAAVFSTTKVRTKVKDDTSWLQRSSQPQEESDEKPWVAEVKASRLIETETSPAPTPTRPTPTSKPTPPPKKVDDDKAPSSGFMIRGIFTTTEKPAPSPTSNGTSGSKQFIKKTSDTYKKIAPHIVRSSENTSSWLSPEEQEKRTEAASSVLKSSAGRQRSYVLSAAKKYESQEKTPDTSVVNNSLSFVAKRVEITDDDDDGRAATAAPAATLPSSPATIPATSATTAPQPEPWKIANSSVKTSVSTTVKTTVTSEEPVPPKVEASAPEAVKEETSSVSLIEGDLKPGCTKVATPLPELVMDSDIPGDGDVSLLAPAPVSDIWAATSPTSTLPAAMSPTSALPAAMSPTSALPAATSPTSTLPAAMSPTSALPAAMSPTSALPAATSPTSTLPAAMSPTSALPAAMSPTSTLPAATSPTSTLPAATSPTSTLPAATSPTSTLPAAMSPKSTLPPAMSPTSALPAAMSPTSTLPAATSPTSTLPAAVSPTSTLPAAVSPTSTLPAAVSPTSTLPAAISPTSALPAAMSPTLAPPTPGSSTVVSSVLVSTVTEDALKTDLKLEESANPSSNVSTLTALSDTLISFDKSSTSFKVEEPALAEEEEGSAAGHIEDGVESEPAPSNSEAITNDLLTLSDGPEDSTEPVPPSPGRWSQDLLSGLDRHLSEPDPAKTSPTPALLSDNIIVINTVERNLGGEREEEKQTGETATETLSTTKETVTVTTKTVIITENSPSYSVEDIETPQSSYVTRTVTESSSTDPFDPYPIETTSANSSSNVLEPLSDISITSVSRTFVEETDPSPAINVSSSTFESSAEGVGPLGTESQRLSTPRLWAHRWATGTEESQEPEPKGQTADQQTLVTFERKSSENDSPWDKWTSPTVYTITTATEEEEEEDEQEDSPEDSHTVTTITTIRETYHEPEPAMDRYETYSVTARQEDQHVPKPEPKKAFVYVKEYLNASELSTLNPRDNFNSGSDYLTSSSTSYSYSSPSIYSSSLSSPCTYCGELVGNDAKITIDHLGISCHPACFKCAVCSKPMGDLFYNMFLHGGKVHCESCYSRALD